MAFSIEAMIAIPLCLSLLGHSTRLAAPVAHGAKSSAVMAAYAASVTKSNGSACRHYTLEKEHWTIPMVETSPQTVVETLSLVHDLVVTIGGVIHPEGELVP